MPTYKLMVLLTMFLLVSCGGGGSSGGEGPSTEIDTDGDGYVDSVDVYPNDPLKWIDGNGVGDNEEAIYDAEAIAGYQVNYDQALWRVDPTSGSWDSMTYQ